MCLFGKHVVIKTLTKEKKEKKNEYIYIFIYFFTEELGKVGVGGYICLATRCFYPCSHFL